MSLSTHGYKSFRLVILGFIAAFVLMLLVNVIPLGNETFVAGFNNITEVTFYTIAAAQCLIYWRLDQNRREGSQVWLFLGLGMAFYALGEIVWVFYNFNGVEAPYPSLGDLFWVISYPLVLIALVNKNRLLGARLDRKQVALSVGLGLVILLVIGFFVLLPILADAGTTRTVEKALNVFYPVMDLLFLITTSFLVITLWRGRLALTWNLIAVGFSVMALADILFVYGSWNGLYYGGGAGSALTQITELGYGLAIMIITAGVLVQKWVLDVQPETIDFGFTHSLPVEPAPAEILALTPEVADYFSSMFLIVDEDQRVFFFSDSFRQLSRQVESATAQWGKPLHRVLGIEETVVDTLFAEVARTGQSVHPAMLQLGHYRVPVVYQARSAKKGIDIYLKYQPERGPVILEEKTPVETLLINETLRSVKGLENTTSQVKEACAFFMIEVQELYLFLVRMSGLRVGQILAEKFNAAAEKKALAVRIQDGQVQLTNAIPPAELAGLLKLTIQTVRDLTSVEAVQEILQQLNHKIPEHILHLAQEEGLAGDL